MSIWRLPGSQEGASSLHCHLCLLQLSPALSEGEAPDQFLWYKCQALKTLSSSVWSSPHLTHTAPVGRTGTAANSTFGAWKWRVKAILQNCHTGTVTLLILHRSQSQYLRHSKCQSFIGILHGPKSSHGKAINQDTNMNYLSMEMLGPIMMSWI